MVTDPVCGREIDPQHAGGQTVYDGTTYYFCSEDDKRKFEGNPTFYLGNRPVQTRGVDVIEGHSAETTTKGVDVTEYRPDEKTRGTDVIEGHGPETISEGVDVVEREQQRGG